MIKKGGSKLNQEMPFLWTQIYLNAFFEIDKVAKAVSGIKILML